MAALACSVLWPALKSSIAGLSGSNSITISAYRASLREFCQNYATMCDDRLITPVAISTLEIEQEEEIVIALSAMFLQFYRVECNTETNDVLSAENWLHNIRNESDEEYALSSVSLVVLYVDLAPDPDDTRKSTRVDYSDSDKHSDALSKAFLNGNLNSSINFREHSSLEENRDEFLCLLHCLSYLLRGRRSRVSLCDEYGSIFVPFFMKMMQAAMVTLENCVLWWSDFLEPPESSEKDERRSPAPADRRSEKSYGMELCQQTQFSLSAWIGYLHICSWSSVTEADGGDTSVVWSFSSCTQLGLSFLIGNVPTCRSRTISTEDYSRNRTASAEEPIRNRASSLEIAGSTSNFTTDASSTRPDANLASVADLPLSVDILGAESKAETEGGEVAESVSGGAPERADSSAPDRAIKSAGAERAAEVLENLPENLTNLHINLHKERVYKLMESIQRRLQEPNSQNDRDASLDAFQRGVVRSGLLKVVLALLRKLCYLTRTLHTPGPTELLAKVSHLHTLTSVVKTEAMQAVHAIITLSGTEALALYHFSGGPAIMASLIPISLSARGLPRRSKSARKTADKPTHGENQVPAEVEVSVTFLQTYLSISVVLRFLRLACMPDEMMQAQNNQLSRSGSLGSRSSRSSAHDADKAGYRSESLDSAEMLLSALKPFIKWLFSVEEQEVATALTASLGVPASDATIHCVCDRSLGSLPFPTDLWPWCNEATISANTSEVLLPIDISKFGITDYASGIGSEYLTRTAQKAAKCIVKRGFETRGLATKLLDWMEVPVTTTRLAEDSNASKTLPQDLRWLFSSRRGRFCHGFFSLLIELVCYSCTAGRDITIENIETAILDNNTRPVKHDPLLSAILTSLTDSLVDLEQGEQPKKSEIPCFQGHVLLFVMCLLKRQPVQALTVAKYCKVWSTLIRSPFFLMSGQRSDCSMDYSGQASISWKNFDTSSDKGGDRMWSLTWRRGGQDAQTIEKSNVTYSYACVRDMTLELLTVVVEATYADRKLSYIKLESPEIAERMLDCLRSPLPDFLAVHILRWLQKFTFRYHDHRFNNAAIWPLLASKCISLCKSQIFSMQTKDESSISSPAATPGSDTSTSTSRKAREAMSTMFPVPKTQVQARALLWPARVAVLQTIQLLMRLPECAGWMSCFTPLPPDSTRTDSRSSSALSDSRASGKGLSLHDPSNTSASKPQRHLVFLRLAMDSRCRAAALDILYAVLHQCAQIMYLRNVSVSELEDKDKVSRESLDEGLEHESMAHDIISGLIRIVSVSSRLQSSTFNAFPVYGHKSSSNAEPHTNRAISCWSNYLDVHEGNFPLAYLSSSVDESDCYGAALGALQTIILLNREPTFGRVHNMLFSNYGQSSTRDLRKDSKKSQGFTWSPGSGAPNIFNALLFALETAIRTDTKHVAGMLGLLLKYTLSALTSIMIGNDKHKEQFRRLLNSRHKVASATFETQTNNSATSVPAYTYLVDMVLSTVNALADSNDPTADAHNAYVFETVLTFVDMMFDGFAEVPYLRGYSSLNKAFKHRQGKETAEYNDVPNNGYGLFAENKGTSSSAVASKVPIIRNLTVVPIFLGMVPSVSAKLQYFILTSISNLTRCRSLINISKVLLLDPPIMELMLSIFPRISGNVRAPAIEILQSVGKHTVSVANLKRMFRLLRTKNNVRPSYTIALLEAVVGMIQVTDGPRNYLFFQGRDSGLLLPALSRYPSSRGFSFSTWFLMGNLNVESSQIQVTQLPAHAVDSASSGERSILDFAEYFDDAQAATGLEYRPVLLSLRLKCGAGVEISFGPSDAGSLRRQSLPRCSANLSVTITIFSSNKNTPPAVVVREVTMQPDQKWHHIAVSCSPAGYRSNSEMVLVLNGVETQHKVPYPFDTSDSMPFPLIGACEPQYQTAKTHTAFCGQLGAVYFFAEPIHPDYLRCIYKLGPAYCNLFNQNDQDLLGDVFDADIAKVMENVLAPAIMFALNPGISKGKTCTDVTPVQNKCRWTKFRLDAKKERANMAMRPNFEPHALLMKNTLCNATSDLRDALDCLGGIKVLFPLFLQLKDAESAEESRLSPPDSTASALASATLNTGSPLLTTPDSNMCAKILEIMFSVLRPTAENNKLLSGQGFLLISNLLERLPPSHVNMATLDVLIAQSRKASWRPSWHDNLMIHFLCNFRLWKHTPYPVQRKLFAYLLEYATESTRRCLTVLSVQKLLDVLSTVYGEVPGRPIHCDVLGATPLSRSSSAVGGMRRSMSSARLKIPTDLHGSRVSRSASEVHAPTFGTEGPSIINSSKEVLLLPAYSWSNTPCTHCTPSQHASLRAILLQIVYILLMRTSDTAEVSSASAERNAIAIEEDIHQLVLYIALPALDSQYKVEGLRIFLRLLTNDDMARRVLSSLAKKQDLIMFLSIINHGTTAQVRLYSLICICAIVHSACRLGKLPVPVFPTVPVVPRPTELYNCATAKMHTETAKTEIVFAPGFAGDNDENASVFMPGFTPVRRSKLAGGRASGAAASAKPAESASARMEPADLTDGTSVRRTAKIASPSTSATTDDVFSDLGLSMARMSRDFLWIVSTLLQHIRLAIESEQQQSSSSPLLHKAPCFETQAQCGIIFAALQFTMHGESCKHLIHAIDGYVNAARADNPSAGHVDRSETTSPELSTVHDTEDTLPGTHGLFHSSADEMTLAARSICVPMLLPAIFQLISYAAPQEAALLPAEERSQGLQFRTRCILQLKTGLQSFSNHDALLCTPNWQDCIFRFLSCEQQFQLFADATAEEVERSRDLTDIVIQLLCDIHVHAVRCGSPSKLMMISRPESSQYIQVHKMTSRELLELLRDGGRGIGVSVIQETIFCLRCHATMGTLNVNKIGMKLLQATIAVMKRENEYLADLMAKNERSKESNSELVGIQKRLMTLNIWLLADIALEFTTIPPIQAMESSPRSRAKTSASRTSAFSPASPTMSSQDSFIDSPQSSPDTCVLPSTSLAVHKLSSDISATSNAPPSLEAYLEETSFARTSLAFPPPDHESQHSTVTWALVDSLLGLIGPMDSVVSALSANDRFDRFMLGLKVGFRLGRQVTHQMDASVEAMWSQATSPPKRQSTLVSARETSLSKTVEKVLWVLLRVMLSTYLQSVPPADETTVPSTASGLKALEQLSNLLGALRQNSKEFYRTESIHIAARIAEDLHQSGCCPSCDWFQKGIELVARLCKDHRTWLAERLMRTYAEQQEHTKLIAAEGESALLTTLHADLTELERISLASDSADIRSIPTSRPATPSPWDMQNPRPISAAAADIVQSVLQKSHTAASASTVLSPTPLVRQSSPTPQRRSPDHTAAAPDESFQQADLLLMAMCRAANSGENASLTTMTIKLCIQSGSRADELDNAASAQLANLDEAAMWELWASTMKMDLLQQQEKDDLVMVSRLTEIGLHRDAEHVLDMLNVARTADEATALALTVRADETIKARTKAEHQRLREQRHNEQSIAEKSDSEWGKIYYNLANDRGPWGGGTLDVSDVLWELDPAEDAQRMFRKLIPNPRGTRHQTTSTASRQSFSLAAKHQSPPSVPLDNAARADGASLTADGAADATMREVGNRPPADSEDFLTLDLPLHPPDEEPTKANVPTPTAAQITTKGSFTLGSSTSADDDELNALVTSLARFTKNVNKESSGLATGSEEESMSGDDSGGVDPDDNSGSSGDETTTLQAPTAFGHVNDLQHALPGDAKNVFFSKFCEVILQSTNYTNPPAYGLLEVTSSSLLFTRHSLGAPNRDELFNSLSKNLWRRNPIIESLPACQACPSTSWNCADIRDATLRYYQLRLVGVELFFTNRRTVFINLLDPAAANLLLVTIRKYVKPPHFAGHSIGSRSSIVVGKMGAGPHSLTKARDAWVEREITNFEYLMTLNTIAGRTFNDLGQYPVFPWVLADYTSEFLDLRKKSSYRDLQWPIGAQSPTQRDIVINKYLDLEQAYDFAKEEEAESGVPAPCLMPPYHWGSHYSVPGFVLWYLLRLEPFTSLHVQLQDGKFDKADRLFNSLEATYKGCTTNSSDVKELIPEIFYCPEMLLNINRVDFGVTQKGEVVDAVKLPPWANDAYDFIFQHRLALESDYVSQNLHSWIDLIFGCRQRPPHVVDGSRDAVDACNVFFHLTYAGAVDLDDLYKNDRVLYEQYVCQIAEFGQTPAQLFSTPHERRKSFRRVDIFWPMASIVPGVDTIMDSKEQPDRPKRVYSFKPQKISAYPVIFIAECTKSDRLVTVDTSQIVGQHVWSILSPDVVPPFKIKVDSVALEVSLGSTGQSMLSQLSSTISAMSPMAGASSHVLAQNKRIPVPFSSQFLGHIAHDSGVDASATQLTSDIHTHVTHGRTRSMPSIGEKYLPMTVLAFIASEDKLHTYQSTKPGSSRAYERMSRSDSSRSSSRHGQQVDFLPMGSQRRISQQMLEREDGGSAATAPGQNSTTVRDSRSRSASSAAGSGSTTGGALPKATNVGKPISEQHLSNQLFAVLPAARLLFSVGHWDLTMQVTHLDTGRTIQAVKQHSDVITCIALENDNDIAYLVTGSADCTLQVWEVSSGAPLGSTPLHILYGHDDTVTTVSISCELNVVVSGSNDGTIIVHNLREGTYVRSITAQAASLASTVLSTLRHSPSRPKSSLPEDMPPIRKGAAHARTRNITWVGVSKTAQIVCYSRDDFTLCTYTLNGVLLATKVVNEHLHCLVLSQDGHVLVTGGDNCLVVMRWTRTLELANDGPRTGLEAVVDGSLDSGTIPPFEAPIRSIHLTAHEMHMIVGDELGNLRILVQDSDYLRQRLQRKLMEIGIL